MKAIKIPCEHDLLSKNHKVQKLKKYIDQLKLDHENLVDADLFDKGYKQALYNVIEDLKDILK